MKITLGGFGKDGVIVLTRATLETLGWKQGDELIVDVPVTGPGLIVYKESDPIVLMGGVKEVIHG